VVQSGKCKIVFTTPAASNVALGADSPVSGLFGKLRGRAAAAHQRWMISHHLAMKAFVLSILFIFCLTRPALAQKHSPPRFEDYPTSGIFRGSPGRLDLPSHPQAPKFRAVLRDSLKSGANFAGRYAVNYWGCETECIRVGIVDLKTGRAYIAPFFTSFDIAYRIDSRLLIVEPQKTLKEIFGAEVPQAIHPRYYLSSNNRLVLIHPKNERNNKAEDYWK
jgi:hypothetical protein